jgi:zinc protease
VETTAGLASELGELAQFGLPLSNLQSYAADIAAVTPEQTSAAAKKHFDLAKANLVVVGDASVFFPALKALRPNVERLGVDKLNLDSPSLK